MHLTTETPTGTALKYVPRIWYSIKVLNEVGVTKNILIDNNLRPPPHVSCCYLLSTPPWLQCFFLMLHRRSPPACSWRVYFFFFFFLKLLVNLVGGERGWWLVDDFVFRSLLMPDRRNRPCRQHHLIPHQEQYVPLLLLATINQPTNQPINKKTDQSSLTNFAVPPWGPQQQQQPQPSISPIASMDALQKLHSINQAISCHHCGLPNNHTVTTPHHGSLMCPQLEELPRID